MKAITYDRYGPPEVLKLEEAPKPEPKSDEMLIEVRATAVTTADWRLRASEFPGAMWPIGRLMFGIFNPRNKILGADVAGEVAAVGPDVSSFQVGDAVFGHIGKGGHAEFVIAKEGGAIVPKPDGLTYQEAAAVPFGALCSLVFLRDFAKLNKEQRVLIIGASGNVGVYAIQIAKILDCHVTAVASGKNSELVQSLGADQFVDYQKTELTKLNEKFDLIFDTYGLLAFADAGEILIESGTFVPLNFGIGSVFGPGERWHCSISIREGCIMGQILHGSAATTPAVPAAIQRSKASVAELAAQYHLNPKTVPLLMLMTQAGV